MSYAGELAALGTALCWSLSSIFFTVGGRRVGSVVVNRARLLMAVLLVGTVHLLLMGTPFPLNAGRDRFFWLGLSAVVGLVLGDGLLFQAYLLVGTRIGALLLSLAPVFGAALAWLLLGERMSLAQVAAMALALGGVAWVVLERNGSNGETRAPRRHYLLGVLMGMGAALGQASGLVLAKQGLAGDFPALSAVVIRMSVAMAVLWLWTGVRGQVGDTVRALRYDRRAELAILGGAIAGPTIGVWLSLVAVQAAPVGIASTLMAMTPITLLPMVRWVFHEQISPRAIFGTLIAMAGVAGLILV